MAELGQNYIELTQLYNNTSKGHIIKKINEHFPDKSGGFSLAYRNEYITKQLGLQSQLVDLWLNPRRDGKMPLIKLCELAVVFGVKVEQLLNNNEEVSL